MILSPSQYGMIWGYWHPDKVLKPQDFKSTCERNWFLAKVLKVPQPERAATNLGTVLHAVVERYLLADDNGRDILTGEPVDLYPDDWDSGIKYESDRDLVRSLINYAIEEGLLKRRAGRKVEEAMSDGVKHWGGFGESIWKIFKDTYLTGFIDHRYGNVIEDWKTSSDPAKWGLNNDPKSTKYLGYDIKMLMYAAWLHYFDPQEEYVLRHVYFDKKSTPEEPTVVPGEVTVAAEHVEKFTKGMMEAAMYMSELKENNSQATLTKMHKGKTACDNYGGCVYQKICNRQLTIEQHTKLLTQEKEDPNMSALDKLRKGKKNVEQKTPDVSETVETPKAEEIKPVEKKTSPPESTKKQTTRSTEKKAPASNDTEKHVAKPEPRDASKTDFALFINCRPSVGFKPSKSIQGLLLDIKTQTDLKCGIWDRCNFYEEHIDGILKGVEGANIVANNYSTEAGHLLDLLIPRAKVVVEG